MEKSCSKMYLTIVSCKINVELRAVSGHSSYICVTLCSCRPLLLGIFTMWLDSLKVGNTKQLNINRQWWYILTAVCLKIYPDGRYIMSLCLPLRSSCVRWAPARWLISRILSFIDTAVKCKQWIPLPSKLKWEWVASTSDKYNWQWTIEFLILSFRRFQYVICFFLGNSPASWY